MDLCYNVVITVALSFCAFHHASPQPVLFSDTRSLSLVAASSPAFPAFSRHSLVPFTLFTPSLEGSLEGSEAEGPLVYPTCPESRGELRGVTRHFFPNSFPCHTSKISDVTPVFATDPKGNYPLTTSKASGSL